MEVRFLGDPAAGPTLDLDHDRFAYAGKFRMTNTGKAVVVDDGERVGAAAFNEDRTDESAWWIRYLTVRADRRGEGLGTRLVETVSDHLLDRDAVRVVRIAVNNPYAYEACYTAGFRFTGDRTGLAELVLERPGEETSRAYRRGLEAFQDRPDLSDSERAFIEARLRDDPPE